MIVHPFGNVPDVDSNVIGLDLSLRHTGLAVYGKSGFEYSTYSPKSRGVARLELVKERVDEFVASNRPRLVMIEGYAYAGRGRVFDIGELGGLIKWSISRMNYEYILVPPMVLKKHITGIGNANKMLMRTVLENEYGTIDGDDNAVDALALAKMGRQMINLEDEALSYLCKCEFQASLK